MVSSGTKSFTFHILLITHYSPLHITIPQISLITPIMNIVI